MTPISEDRFYDYSQFETERLKRVMFGWDGLGGYHGLLIKRVARRIPAGVSVFDVGCGLCHLHEEIDPTCSYVGVDIDPRVVAWAKERYPDLPIFQGSVYDLSEFGNYNIVAGIGLYSGEPEDPTGVREMLRHATDKIIITYFHKKVRGTPPFLKDITDEWYCYKRVVHNIDKKVTILEVLK